MALHFDRPEEAAETVLRQIERPPDAVLAVDDSGVELAALLTHSLGMSLEELILREVLGEPFSLPQRDAAAGVMMIPVARRGIYEKVEGLAAAQAAPGIVAVAITAHPGQLVAPPPDGAACLGFIFARAGSAARAEHALRDAFRLLRFDIRPDFLSPPCLSTKIRA